MRPLHQREPPVVVDQTAREAVQWHRGNSHREAE